MKLAFRLIDGIVIRLALWLLRHHRIRVRFACPHGESFPWWVRLDRTGHVFSCDKCAFRFRLILVKDPYAP